MIRGILEQLGKKTGLIGTVQNMIGDRIVPAHYTTPEPYELNKLFSDMVEENCEYCVMEVSSQALAQGRVDGCVFDIAVFTNLTQEHLDYHKTMENYLAAKHILFENSKIAIVNCDDSYAESIVAGTNCKVLTYSAEKDEADFTAKNIKLSSDGVQFELVNCENIGRITLHIPGRFSIYNAMAAASAVVVAGMPFEDVVECFF